MLAPHRDSESVGKGERRLFADGGRKETEDGRAAKVKGKIEKEPRAEEGKGTVED